MLARATSCLSLPPETEEGSPLPGVCRTFQDPRGCCRDRAEVSGVALEGRIHPLVVGAGGCACHSLGTSGLGQGDKAEAAGRCHQLSLSPRAVPHPWL